VTPTEDQIEAARTKVRNMLHAADHGNHLGEMAVLRMAASAELLAALKTLDAYIDFSEGLEPGGWGVEDPSGINAAFAQARTALSLAQPYEAEVETTDE
jgi:hypothetical protein